MKIGLITLGCDKNRVDSEKMLGAVISAGHEFVTDIEAAEIAVINTCAFIDKAKKEAIDTILSVAALKNAGSLKKLIVTGCFAQRYMNEVDFPEVDVFLPIADENKIAGLCTLSVEKTCKDFSAICNARVLSTPPHYAYLKIADGCNNRCSYCAIPSIRGNYISYPLSELAEEAKDLCSRGVKELILVAQDTTRYKPSLLALLKELTKLDFWKIRLMYTYPELITDELLDYIVENPKIANYLDIPFQHIDDGILHKMNRRTSENDLRNLTKKLRERYPQIVYRTSFIAGFPTETEEAHKKLLDFVSEGADYAGFFAFSREEGTPAYDMKPQIPKGVSKARVKMCEIAQSEYTVSRHARLINQIVEVIYEGIDFKKQLFFGRNEYNAPEIDTLVYFTSRLPLEIGRVYTVKITETGFHLYGEVVN